MEKIQRRLDNDELEEVKTYFASPGRTDEATLAEEIEFASNNPVISGLLHTISGLIAILDENRQIIAVNNSLLDLLDINDPELALGLRLGEALKCIHAHEEPAGCGTTKYCSSCGAAIAMVTCLDTDGPAEKICALTAKAGTRQVNKALLVKAHPLKMNNKRFMLLFLQDITRDQQRAALERTFFHDISNMLSLLVGASELIARKEPSKLSNILYTAANRLVEEVAIQRYLTNSESETYKPKWGHYSGGQIIGELKAFFNGHPVATDKEVEFSHDYTAAPFWTDISLLMRILCNMITNALEASGEHGLVRVWIEEEGNGCHSFNVWNEREIPESVANRIFQMNFSTKEQAGRGIGTYSMKLLGENILGGKVSFTTSPIEGTVFRILCPCRSQANFNGSPD